MDRMTMYDSLGHPIFRGIVQNYPYDDPTWGPVTESGERVAKRLAAYEDSGLTPEEAQRRNEPVTLEIEDVDFCTWRCSGCNKLIELPDDGYNPYDNKWKYCPACGRPITAIRYWVDDQDEGSILVHETREGEVTRVAD